MREPSLKSWALGVEEVNRRMGSDLVRGLTDDEARKRLQGYGYNRLEVKKESLLKTIAEPFTEPMMILLLTTAILFSILSEPIDAVALFIIICVMASIEIYQERKTESSIRSLRQLSVPTATVIRGEELVEIPSTDIVPGDIVALSPGNRVPADARLFEALNLSSDESSLTGESAPSYKDSNLVLPEETGLGDRKNMVFAGTLVTSGKGKAIVVATGAETGLGKVAELTQSIEEKPTPLQAKISQLTRWIAVAVVTMTTLTVVLGIVRGFAIVESILVGLSLLVVTIPEDLPILVYVILVASVLQMARKKALIRKLYSAETLGSTTIICSDKTGTLTQNIMRVAAMSANGKSFDLQNAKTELPRKIPLEAVQIATLCNDSIPEKGSQRPAVGNAVDVALLNAMEDLGFDPLTVREGASLLREEPFDNIRKMMSTVYRLADGSVRLFAKGAPEVIIAKCAYMHSDGRTLPLTEDGREKLLDSVNRMTENGLRVLALAYKPMPNELLRSEDGMVYEGLVGLEDPPRSGAREAILECTLAGMRPIMATGDHAKTALSIGKAVGLTNNGRVVTGPELEKMTEGQLRVTVSEVSIFARVTPEHKLRIVRALKARNETVAVTGDGVNDGPALKEADIGVAMGSGTDVAKEAASMTLADNNFATIVAAVTEGRRLFDNLRKAVRYYIPSKISILMTVFFSTSFGLSTPLVPLQIILMEVINDIQASTTFATEPAEPDIMHRPPRKRKEPIVTKSLTLQILLRASAIFLGAIFVYTQSLGQSSLEHSRTLVFATLLVSLTFLALFSRSERSPLSRLGLMSNKYMLYVIGLSLLITFLAVSLAPLQLIFSTASLSTRDWLLVIVVSILTTAWIEGVKVLRQLR